jgi:hypothetical protein
MAESEVAILLSAFCHCKRKHFFTLSGLQFIIVWSYIFENSILNNLFSENWNSEITNIVYNKTKEECVEKSRGRDNTVSIYLYYVIKLYYICIFNWFLW